MENKENLFENTHQGSKTFEGVQERKIELKDIANYEQVEKELSSLFKESKKEMENTAEMHLRDDGVAKFERKVEDLLAIAFVDGVEKAIKLAASHNDPFLLDEFHDRLIQELKRRKQN